MSVHEKMQSDYLWVRNAPVEEGLKVRNHGYYFMYDRLPNSSERLEMVYRSIGKQYDWELEKFRLGKKGIDRGNKKRGIKNALRFFKNPVGYIVQKTNHIFNPLPKFLLLTGAAFAFSILYYWKTISEEFDEQDDMLKHLGKNVEGTAGRMKGYHNRYVYHQPNIFHGSMKTHFSNDLVVLNPTWKQNIRKELQLTNYHNVQF